MPRTGKKKCHLLFPDFQVVDRTPGAGMVMQKILSPRTENGTEKLFHARQGVVQFHGEIVLPFGEQIHKNTLLLFHGSG
jgi:hypothetical protein